MFCRIKLVGGDSERNRSLVGKLISQIGAGVGAKLFVEFEALGAGLQKKRTPLEKVRI